MLLSNFLPSCILSHSYQDHDVVCIVGRGIFRLSWICLILMGSTFTQSTILISWFSVFVKDLWKWHPRALRRMCRLIEGVLKSFGFQKVTVHIGGWRVAFIKDYYHHNHLHDYHHLHHDFFHPFSISTSYSYYCPSVRPSVQINLFLKLNNRTGWAAAMHCSYLALTPACPCCCGKGKGQW